MTREDLLSRISINPEICFGKPCVRGRRIWVSLILDFLADGMKEEEIMKEYDLEKEDILACIAYGAEMSRERYFEYPIEARQ
jgi:uncharacterized protein (DUF433 family)